ncbi:FIG00653327: hypothetical protein [hydrothermal vent metagenome]|uniref:Ig-like domain-containing protein n=1 Tax=hydrothermal vent metagenome TaxID=652676 RepID=A0A3B0TM26_9ZZZZ
MKPTILPRFRVLIMILLLMGASQLSAQISMRAPEPAGGSVAWTKICAGTIIADEPFNSFDVTVSWAGAADSGNEFVLELSDSNGSFANPVELARVGNQNTNTAKEFDVTISIPTDTQGQGYKLRAKSTDPVDDEESVSAYHMYYMGVTSNLNISVLGDGNPPGAICSVGPVTLQVDNISSPETYQYVWYRSGTLLVGESGHTLNATTSGMYQALVDYGDCTFNGNTDSNMVDATIGSAGSGIGITPPAQTALCAGDTETLAIDMTDSSWGYQWYQDGNAISGATGISYTVDANIVGFEGDYQVEISATGICTERSAAVAMTNADNFTVTRDNPADIVVLPAQPETLSVTTNAISPTYQWYRNGNNISGATNPTFDITQDGTYYAEITQAGGTCPGTKKNSESTIAVTPASFEIIIDYDSAYTSCVSTSIVLEVATINAVAGDGSKSDVTAQLESSFTYQWKKDGTNVAGATNLNISLTDPSENGNYTVDAVLNTYNETSNMLLVQLLTSETVAITSTSTIYCNATNTITLSTTTDLANENFSWEMNGASVNLTDSSLNVTGPGTYRLVIDKNGCSLISNEIIITTLDPDLITLDIDGDVVFPEGSSKTVTASGGTAYQWFDVDNNLLSNSSSITFTEEGAYLLIATIDNCEISKQITVVYLDLFNVPNVITPNGDGANDQWVVPNSYSNKQDVNVIIYNDSGVELINEMGYQNNWPQSSMSFPKQNMVFYYVIKNATKTLKQGTITVIR